MRRSARSWLLAGALRVRVRSCCSFAHVVAVRAGMQVAGAEAGRVVAAVQDVQRAAQVEAKKQRGREPVNGVAAVGDGDTSVAPAVVATLPLPTARRRVDRPPSEQAFKDSRIVRCQYGNVAPCPARVRSSPPEGHREDLVPARENGPVNVTGDRRGRYLTERLETRRSPRAADRGCRGTNATTAAAARVSPARLRVRCVVRGSLARTRFIWLRTWVQVGQVLVAGRVGEHWSANRSRQSVRRAVG